MIEVDFDFARYVALRRGLIEQRARDGAAYSFGGETKARRVLSTARPVSMAIEATSRRWKAAARERMLSESTLVTDQSFPELLAASRQAAASLALGCPPIYVASDTSKVDARALGTDADPYLFIARRYAETLSPPELTAMVGHLLGHVQNNHVLYSTALFYLQHDAVFFVRWIVQPAIMALQAWSRRAEISCDRAALLAARDLDVTLSFIVRTGTGKLDTDVPAFLDGLESQSSSRFADLFKSYPLVPTRVRALRLFADSMLYRKVSGGERGGRTTEEIDHEIAELLGLF